jgi:hypothetical protein
MRRNCCYNCYMSSDYGIAEVGDGLEIRGVSRSELAEALDLLTAFRALRADPSGRVLAEMMLPGRTGGGRFGPVVDRGELTEVLELLNLVRTLQAEHVDATRDDLLRALMGRNVSLTPTASLNQVRQLATHRTALLATPFHTYASLGQLLDKSESNTRTWVARRREAHEVFTVTYNARTLIPGFQFDEHGNLRPELQPMLSALDEGGVREWSLWTWLTKPTSFLSGEVPEQVARTDPARALRAAQRFAAGPVA